jgi:hypothetical protein
LRRDFRVTVTANHPLVLTWGLLCQGVWFSAALPMTFFMRRRSDFYASQV